MSASRAPWPLVRGRVYSAELAGIDGRKPFAIVSNNRRNARLGSALGVRVTTSPKPAIPSVVDLPAGEVLAGWVVCDDITELFPDEIRADLGALSAPTMARVDAGLAAALGLSRR